MTLVLMVALGIVDTSSIVCLFVVSAKLRVISVVGVVGSRNRLSSYMYGTRYTSSI